MLLEKILPIKKLNTASSENSTMNPQHPFAQIQCLWKILSHLLYLYLPPFCWIILKQISDIISLHLY